MRVWVGAQGVPGTVDRGGPEEHATLIRDKSEDPLSFHQVQRSVGVSGKENKTQEEGGRETGDE